MRAPSVVRQPADDPGIVRRRLLGMAAMVAGLHVAGFGLLLASSAGDHALRDGTTFGLATGLLAYSLGLRHAFDADHISAIDNVTRRFVAEREKPVSVGFWFSLGHSTVVFALAVLLALGVRALGSAVTDEHSALRVVTGLIGPAVSTVFLLAVALANVALLRSAIRSRRTLRCTAPRAPGVGTDGSGPSSTRLAAAGGMDGPTGRREDGHAGGPPDDVVSGGPRGPLTLLFGSLVRRVDRPWKMYPLGILFGLGFDTATEVALLVLAGGSVAAGLPITAILSLPLIFAAGMCACDTVNGIFMRAIYERAADDGRRRADYDIVVTGMSVAVALAVGAVQAISVAGDQLDLTGGVFAWVDGLDMTLLGSVVVGAFLVAWLSMLVVARRGAGGAAVGDPA